MNEFTKPLCLIKWHSPKIAMIALNRPEKRNALNLALLDELYQSLKSVEESEKARSVIFYGEGPIFCAGLDLKENLESDVVEKSSESLATLLLSLHLTPLITIAAVHGAAIAGGAGIMSACDFAIGTSDAKFGYPEVKRGLVAAQVATLLKAQVPYRIIKELLLLGDIFEAEKAKSIGLINKTVSSREELMQEALSYAEKSCEGSPAAIVSTKQLLNALMPRSLSSDLEVALAIHRQARSSDDAKEGIAAFFDKRKPAWCDG